MPNNKDTPSNHNKSRKPSSSSQQQQQPPFTLSPSSDFTERWESVVALLRGKSRICVLAGAGMSVSCGIPDFRSKGTGLYATLNAQVRIYIIVCSSSSVVCVRVDDDDVYCCCQRRNPSPALLTPSGCLHSTHYYYYCRNWDCPAPKNSLIYTFLTKILAPFIDLHGRYVCIYVYSFSGTSCWMMYVELTLSQPMWMLHTDV